MNLSSEILAIVATCNVAVLGYMATSIRALSKKLDVSVCDPLCRERSEKCQRAFCGKIHALEKEDQQLWQRVNAHRHTVEGEVVISHD